MEHIKNGVGLVRLIVEIPPTETSESYTIAASIHPAKLLYVGRRARGFTAAIMDQQGRRVFEEITQTATTPSWFSDLINNSMTSIGSALEFDENGVPMIGAIASFADGALFATIRIPSSVVYFTARELLSNLVIAALLLFALAAAASLVFARRLSKPLEHLADMAEKVGQGEFDVNVDVNSRDEIGTLSSSFNRMTGELREREEKLVGANAALIQSEKLAAFGQIGAGIAHEVKNPLAGILGYTQLALRKVDEDSPLRKNLNIIETETRRCTDIISNLLQFARHEKAEAGPVQINSVVDAAIQIVDHQLGVNNVKITKELGADLPAIKANANQLQQAIMNFAINAQQAMGDEGGNLIVRTHLWADSAVVIEIEDDGPGIPEDIRAKIFDPFFTTKPAGQGTGLGLSVTYGIIKDHGGDIQIESVEHGGTRFVVSLPIQVAKVA
jgi:signal transduction histidine kinase